MYTFKQIKDSLPKDYNAQGSWWVRLWVRRVSFVFTWLFINAGMSANSVTLLSIFVTLAGCVCYAVPSLPFQIAAVVLINFWLVLDCVDGNIARCMKKKTLYGSFIDAMGGYFTVGFVYLAIGISAWQTGGVLFEKGNAWILVAGAMSSISDILARLIYSRYCNVARPETDDANKERALQSKKYSLNWLRKRIGVQLGLSGTFMFLIILGVCLKCNDLVTLFYLAFNGFALLSTTVIYYKKANDYDKNK